MRKLLIVMGILAMIPAHAHAKRPIIVKLLAHEHAQIQRDTTLVDPNGQPIGGRWQHWVDQVRIPTVRGRILFASQPITVGQWCGTAAACSARPPWLATFVSADQSLAAQHDDLYFELGHDFDWQLLTNRDRQFLARLWGVPHAHWFDTERGLQQGAEDGLEADFAAVYQLCAWGQFEVGGLSIAEPYDATVQAPDIYASDPTASCRFIERVGSRLR